MSDVQVRTIESATRLNLSVNGNPRWSVRFTDGSAAITQSDSSVGYEIANYLMESPRLPKEVTFTRAGRIAYMRDHDATADELSAEAARLYDRAQDLVRQSERLMRQSGDLWARSVTAKHGAI